MAYLVTIDFLNKILCDYIFNNAKKNELTCNLNISLLTYTELFENIFN